MHIRSKAPFRLGLAGGGTDVSPYTDLFGGAVLNTTINLYAHTTIIPRTDGKIILRSEDSGIALEFSASKQLPINGELDLQKGVYNRIVNDFCSDALSFELITSMDVPSGSGLGTSSTLVVSMIAAFIEWLKLPLGEYDTAQLAYKIEREDLQMEGGRQDQFAATFGGFNFMEFTSKNNSIVNPLRIRTKLRNELAFCLILYYTQSTRESANIIREQQQNIHNKNKTSTEATHHLKQKAFEMKDALLKGELNKIGELMDESWNYKKNMASGISTIQLETIYETAKKAGAIGGKISGAGGGGFMMFYTEIDKRYAVIRALNNLGGSVINYQFTETGVERWTVL